MVFSDVGFKKARRIPVWISEGYADYSANLASAAEDPDYDLRSRIEHVLDDDAWRSPTGFVDRRHFRWHLLVEYLCSVKGFTFAELIGEEVTEENTRVDMMAWFSTPAEETGQ